MQYARHVAALPTPDILPLRTHPDCAEAARRSCTYLSGLDSGGSSVLQGMIVTAQQ